MIIVELRQKILSKLILTVEINYTHKHMYKKKLYCSVFNIEKFLIYNFEHKISEISNPN